MGTAGQGGPARVAVIAVHGVADQQPGATARELVDLMVASAPVGTTYQALASESITLAVDPFDAAQPQMTASNPTPLGEQRTLGKAMLQSLRSDFQRHGWTTADTSAAGFPSGTAPIDPDADRGIAFSAYLLGKNVRNGAVRESYQTTRTGLQRMQSGVASRVDVFEMYWADLSRLSGSMPRIVTELFTMIFRLSRLGRETVDEARTATHVQSAGATGFGALVRRAGWSAATWLQIGLDWLFANGLAMLFLQLALLATMLLGVGLLLMLDPKLLRHADSAAAVLVLVTGLLIFAYRFPERQLRSLLAPMLLIGIGSLALLVFPMMAPWLAFVLLLSLVSTANEAGLRIADDRFPMARRVGRLLWMITILVVSLSAWGQFLVAGALDLAMVARASIVGVEVALFFIKWLWILVGLLMPIWLIAGTLAARGAGYEAKASIATGRIGLGLSLSAFLAITMTIWALLSEVFAAAVDGVDYSPCIFGAAEGGDGGPPPPASQVARLACSLPGDGASAALQAGEFLQQRFVATTSGFALIAVVLMCLMTYLLAMFVPSVLAEMNLLVKRARQAVRQRMGASGTGGAGRRLAAALATDQVRARRLGRWLTKGYRHLDDVSHAVIGAGVVLGLAAALAFLGEPVLAGLEAFVLRFSQGLLEPMVISAASVAAALVVFGGLLSKYLPGIRGPLDIALDVDNHFREFPRTSIPRARIFSRYVALLRHVSAGGYDHIVIVAHSQGSVITTELLRYLSSDGIHPPAEGARPCVDGKPLPPIRLMTAGCPLRQLYAARFPTLYRWVLTRRGCVSGPQASDIGVVRWINVFCSGDYVGRWLWSDEPDADQDPLAHPMVESVNQAFGRIDAYAGFDPMPPDSAAFDQAIEVELCLGLGAHTHYFEPEQTTVAWLVDRLVAH